MPVRESSKRMFKPMRIWLWAGAFRKPLMQLIDGCTFVADCPPDAFCRRQHLLAVLRSSKMPRVMVLQPWLDDILHGLVGRICRQTRDPSAPQKAPEIMVLRIGIGKPRFV
eukprot:6177592-Pleurochrysis_carterae.AAC.2